MGGRGVSRRAVLAAGAGGAIGGANFFGMLADEMTDDDGLGVISESIGGLENWVQDRYDTDVTLSAWEKNLLVEAVYVEEVERVPQEHIDWLEDYFAAEIDINLTWLDRPEPVPRNTYNRYAPTSDEILCGNDSLYSQVIDERMKKNAHQFFFLPADIVRQKQGSAPKAGFNAGTRSMLSGRWSLEYRTVLTAHELGHSLGLVHTDEQPGYGDGSDLMKSAISVRHLDDIAYSDAEQHAIEENLDTVLAESREMYREAGDACGR